jgi:hypothetical protein
MFLKEIYIIFTKKKKKWSETFKMKKMSIENLHETQNVHFTKEYASDVRVKVGTLSNLKFTTFFPSFFSCES